MFYLRMIVTGLRRKECEKYVIYQKKVTYIGSCLICIVTFEKRRWVLHKLFKSDYKSKKEFIQILVAPFKSKLSYMVQNQLSMK